MATHTLFSPLVIDIESVDHGLLVIHECSQPCWNYSTSLGPSTLLITLGFGNFELHFLLPPKKLWKPFPTFVSVHSVRSMWEPTGSIFGFFSVPRWNTVLVPDSDVVCRTWYLVPVHSICIATHFQIIIVVTTGRSGQPGNGLYVHTQYPVDEDKTWLFDISISNFSIGD